MSKVKHYYMMKKAIDTKKWLDEYCLDYVPGGPTKHAV